MTHSRFRTLAASALALSAAGGAQAGTQPYFAPLTRSAAVAPPNHIHELNSPWQTPAGIRQKNLLSLSAVEADVNQSIQRVANAGTQASMFDMLAYDPGGRYLFIPHETPWGAGVSRHDTTTATTHLLFAGDQAANVCAAAAPVCPQWAFDFGAFDPARWTPNGTVIAAEEWTGRGRVVELLHPLAPAPADPTARAQTQGTSWRVLDAIPKVSHEGINFSVKDPARVIYFIDEWNSGSVYKVVLKTPGEYTAGGQSFVLAVDAFVPTGGDPAANWNEGPNVGATRFGPARWQPITDANGNTLPGRHWNALAEGPTADPRTQPATRGGRGAADEAHGTPYGRPEDIAVGLLANGNEVLYVTTTSEHAVVSVEITGPDTAVVRSFASRDTPRNVDFLPTTGTLDNPDNLAIDALGNVYIVEDGPNSGAVGGDVWFARYADNDAVAESLDHFMSIRVGGSEATGMVFHPADPTRFAMAVQHPASTDLANVPDGFGDAVWEFDLTGVVPPLCASHAGRDRAGAGQGQSCIRAADFSFVRALECARSSMPVAP